MSRSKPKPKTPDEIAVRRYHEAEARREHATFGLHQQAWHDASVLDGDAIGLLLTIAEVGHLRVGAMGNGLAHLVGQGFIEIKNGGACEFGADMRGAGRHNGATAKLTMDGYRALLLRVARRMRGLDLPE